ncbi:hypothetical protein HDK77DRAFT_213119 [Phyllosticta capitalensis]|uniref:uncharacterized protein n=1 Tax=Phyllosticta capitalensis TaxID=121624 RepID=UPI00313124AB
MGLTRIARVKRLNRPLLVTFDAYGTLYRPRAPVHLMYKAVAEEHGLRVKSEQALSEAFMQVFRVYAQQYPNYGKKVLDHPDKWWEMIVKETFEKCKLPGYNVPKMLAPDLIKRFSGSSFYHYDKSVPAAIKTLRNIEANSEYPVIIGVVSNSDPRIASILRSLRFSVGDDAPMCSLTNPDNSRAAGILSGSGKSEQQPQLRQPPPIVRTSRPDFDFVLASYDANHEKPEKKIFELAERYAATMMRQLPAPAAHDSSLFPWPYPFHRVHVGDDMNRDAIAAKDAGWKAVFFEKSFMRKLSEEEQERLGSTTVRCVDLARGVKKATDEWIDLVNVRVEMKEDEKEAIEMRGKESRKESRKMEKMDPEQLAETYERRIDEYMSDSTPGKLGLEPSKNTAGKRETKPVPADSMRDHFATEPEEEEESSTKSGKAPPSHIAEWQAAGVKKNLTNISTSFLRPSSLQKMRKLRGGPDEPILAPPGSPQEITRSPRVRAQRAKQRQRSKLANNMEAKSEEPVVLEPGTVEAYLARKREMLGSRHVKDWQAAGQERRKSRAIIKKMELREVKEGRLQEIYEWHEPPPEEQESELREDQLRQHEQEQDTSADSKKEDPSR